MKRYVAMIAVANLLTGCAGISVSDQPSSGGIPFYVKKPILTQETTFGGNELSVQIKIFEGKDPKTRKQVVAFPDAVPLQVPASNESISQLEELKVKLDQLDQKRADLSEWEIIAREGISKLQKFRYSKPLTHVVVNTWQIDMVVNPELHYIKSQAPVFGSVQSDFKFAPDGTLTESSSQVQDQTASTLLAVFPVTGLASKIWGLIPVPPKPGQRTFGLPNMQLTIELSIVEKALAYTARRRTPWPALAVPGAGAKGELPCDPYGDCPPLNLTDALQGKNGTQLISEATPNTAERDDAPSFGISGKITLPKASKGNAPQP